MRPTIHNGPLPRMRRQPMKISVMLHQRRMVRMRRAVRASEIIELRKAVSVEQVFERGLGSEVETVWNGSAGKRWSRFRSLPFPSRTN
jgi:hypothetical protein